MEIDHAMEDPRALAMAALSICESMLLSLEDRGLVDAEERRNLLEDVVETHLHAAAQGGDPLLHKNVARVARAMQLGTHLDTRSRAGRAANGSGRATVRAVRDRTR